MSMDSEPISTLPDNHAERIESALLSLDGLSVGDAFGECFLEEPRRAEYWMEHRQAPPAPWTFTVLVQDAIQSQLDG